MIASFSFTKVILHLQKDLQVLRLCVLQDLLLQVTEGRNTHVHLVIWSHDDAGDHIVTDLRPI